MPPGEQIEGVGIGVSLFDGPSTLETLRAIRAEMVEISQLSGRSTIGGKDVYGPSQADLSQREQNYRKEEEIERKHIASMARIRAEGNRPIEESEIDLRARQKTRQREVARQTEQRIAEQDRQSEERIQNQAQAHAERMASRVASSRSRVQQNFQSDDILFNDFSSERRSFKKYRNDPARDEQTNIYRDQLASQISAQRLAQRAEKAQLDRLSQERVDAEAQRTAKRNAELARIAQADRAKQAERDAVLDRFAAGREGSLATRDPNRPLTRPAPSRAEQEKAELRAYTRAGGDASKFRFSGGSGGPNPPGGGGDDEEGSGRGGFGAQVGRLTRNYLIYRAISLVTTDLVAFTKESLAAAKAVSEQGNALLFATEAAHGNLEANRELAGSLEKLGFNRATSQQVVATAARATFRHPELTAPLAKEATDIAALRGGGLQETSKVIEDIIGGRDRAYREYFNQTPEEIYKDAAKKKIAQNTDTFGLKTVGKQDYETEAQKISKYVTALSEEEKEQLRLNYVLSQSFRFQGDAAERATTLAGKMDLVSASFFNAAANVGAFIADIKPVKDILDGIANSSPTGLFAPPVLKQSGPQNTITEGDIQNFGTDSAYGPRAQALRTISGLAQHVADNITPANTYYNLFRDYRDKLFGGLAQGNKSESNNVSVSDSQYDAIVAQNIARDKQVRQLNVLRQQGQLGYTNKNATATSGDLGQYFTYEELVKKGVSRGDILKNYIEEIKPVLEDGAKALEAYRKKRLLALQAVEDHPDSQVAKNALNALDAARDAEQYKAFKPPDYDKNAAEREQTRKEAEQKQLERDRKKADETYSQQANALNKLRDAQQGGFRLVGDNAGLITGNDNPYTRVLSDQITLAQRMQQQWGFLGDAVVDYQTKLEKAALDKSINKLQFGTYEKASGLLGQAAQERNQRDIAPGLSRKDEDYLNIQTAIVNKATQIPQLWKAAAESLGYTVNPLLTASQTIRNLQTSLGLGAVQSQSFPLNLGPDGVQRGRNNTFTNPLVGGNRIEGFSTGEESYDVEGGGRVTRNAGRKDDYAAYDRSRLEFARLSPEVQRRTREQYADSAIATLQNLSPRQLQQSGLGGVYRQALGIKASGLDNQIEEAQKKAQFGAVEDARLSNQLKADEAFRRQQIRAGHDPNDVGEQSDKLLISRTNGISPKDLTFDQFQGRQEALRRESERTVNEEKEAKAAVAKGLEYQESMNKELQIIREAILGGDVKMLVQVQNDTQARIDQESLKKANPNATVNLDQGSVKSNPYSSSLDLYGPGGRKRR